MNKHCLDPYEVQQTRKSPSTGSLPLSIHPHIVHGRPCFAIGYDTPVGYRKKYYKGELDRKDTFSKRELSELPKFVQKRKNHADNQKVE